MICISHRLQLIPLPFHRTHTAIAGSAVPAVAKNPKKLVTPAAKPPSNTTTPAAPAVDASGAKAPSKTPAKKTAEIGVKCASKVPAKKTDETEVTPAAMDKGKGQAADKRAKAPRAKNAYMFFMADKRDAVKGMSLLVYLLYQDMPVCKPHNSFATYPFCTLPSWPLAWPPAM